MLLAVQVLMPVQAAFATHNNPPANAGKVYVCKYVGTPNVNERLQTGQNPIEVSVNATGGAAVGSYFNDAQGRSYVLGPVVAGQPAPDVTACPKVIKVADISIVQNPVCGPQNDTFTIAPLANVTFSQSGWFFGFKTVYATKAGGYSWSDGDTDATKSFTFRDMNTQCDTVIPVPPKPSVTDPCGPSNASWNVPANTSQYSWSIDQAGNLIVTAKSGYTFAGDVKTHNYGKPTDSGLLCEVPVPPRPSVTDPCNLDGDNATWNIPANTSQYSWSVDQAGNLIVTALGGKAFPGQQATHNYGKPVDSGIKCATPVKPAKIDICGRLHDRFTVPSTEGIDYYMGDTKLTAGEQPALLSSFTVTAMAQPNYELQGANSWMLNFTDEYCEPDVKVKLSTYCHADGQKFALKVRNTTWSSQEYKVVVKNDQGDVVYHEVVSTAPYESKWVKWLATTDGTYTFKVYSFNGNERGEKLWKTAVTTECATDVFTPEIYKRDQFGNLVPGAKFTIEVCQLTGQKGDFMSLALNQWECKTYYNVDLGSDGTWFEENVEYDHYKPTQVNITETYTPPACTAQGPWSFTWGYPEDSRFRVQHNGGHHGSMGVWSNGTSTWDLMNNCIQGQGGAGGSQGGQGSASGELPDELPMTGGNQALTGLIVILATLTTYGVAYFAQPRKSYEG